MVRPYAPASEAGNGRGCERTFGCGRRQPLTAHGYERSRGRKEGEQADKARWTTRRDRRRVVELDRTRPSRTGRKRSQVGQPKKTGNGRATEEGRDGERSSRAGVGDGRQGWSSLLLLRHHRRPRRTS
jgi:hypothetical protein